MELRVTRSFATLGATCVMFSASLIHAQLPRLKGCAPSPILASEIKKMQAETAPLKPKVHIVKVSFVGTVGLPQPARARLIRRIEEPGFDNDPDWPVHSAEVVKQTMQDYGYFNAAVRPQVGVASSGAMGEQAWVTFYVTEGPQFRLEQIQFANAHVFPVAKLRKQVPLRDGAIFDLSKVRLGIQTLTTLYDEHGYINFVARPDVHVDNAHQRISVVVHLDEGHQFKVGSVQILGLDQKVPNHALKLDMKPGMIFRHKLVEDFYKQNKTLLPADASPGEDTTVTQDARTHTVALVFDFRPCPPVTK